MQRQHRRRWRRLWTLLIAAMVAVGTPFVILGTANAATPVRVMPLGDSITGSNGCWRALLWQHLQRAGYTNVDFVGTLNNPYCSGSFDPDNEGHGGYLATQIANNNLLPGWLSATNPDIVMMMLGTNDVWSHLATSSITDAYTTLLGQMRARNPNVKLLIARILPMNPSGCSDCPQGVVNLDDAIPGWASAHSTAQSPITVVDQYTGFNTATDTVDGVHPNDSTGIQKVESRWYPALTAALSPVSGTPTSAPPTSTPPAGGAGPVHAVGAGRCLDVPNASQANNTQLEIWDCNGGTNQRFTTTNAKQLTVYGNKCLDASGHGRTNGTPVIIWDCGSGTNQQWNINTNGTITGAESGLCLDVTGGSTTNGALVQLWTCNGGSQQQWRIDGTVPTPPASPSSSPTSGGGGAPALHVSGNRLVTASGATYRLLGVNRSGGEFSCIQGNGMWNGPMDQASINAMKTWNIRAVRVPLNEECWLGTGDVPSGGAGAVTYQNNVKAYVNLLLGSGITPLLEMHWNYGQYTGPSSGCADVKATCQKPMPDAQYAPSFWTGVANAFKDNRVVFDLFNEPYPERATGSAASGWKCWRDGGTCAGIGYQVAGFQGLVNAVRATGNTNVILLGGLAYSNDLTQWLQYKPADPTGNLGAFAHIYNFNSCASTSCYDSQLAPVAAQVPLTLSEIGENDCGSGFVGTIMNWADAHSVGYLGWTWNNWDCSTGPSLISDYNGTPTNFGAGIRAHLLAQSS
ncbi:ricin-type beta-trefoil lectin domain protein [Dactylosporangium sp. NPDC051541]|uniref:ricin-type beta-trefoil lectin domain protein n=1 Tax=Dactylosporangium sp. NPDC051541 TaxID=3363977 RepID=UPI003794F971